MTCNHTRPVLWPNANLDNEVLANLQEVPSLASLRSPQCAGRRGRAQGLYSSWQESLSGAPVPTGRAEQPSALDEGLTGVLDNVVMDDPLITAHLEQRTNQVGRMTHDDDLSAFGDLGDQCEIGSRRFRPTDLVGSRGDRTGELVDDVEGHGCQGRVRRARRDGRSAAPGGPRC